jgi:hypothetical protein
MSPRFAHLIVVDAGPGFAPESVPEPDLSALGERDGGLWLMRQLAFLSDRFPPSGGTICTLDGPLCR